MTEPWPPVDDRVVKGLQEENCGGREPRGKRTVGEENSGGREPRGIRTAEEKNSGGRQQ